MSKRSSRQIQRGCLFEISFNKIFVVYIERVVAQWCNPLTLQSEQSGGVGSIPGRAQPLECHDRGSRTRLTLSYFCNRSVWRENLHPQCKVK